MEGELGLEVGLLEVREDTPRVGRFVLRVEVALAVCRIHESVHALPGAAVQGRSCDRDLVLGLQVFQPDPGTVHHVRHRQVLAVEEHAVDLSCR